MTEEEQQATHAQRVEQQSQDLADAQAEQTDQPADGNAVDPSHPSAGPVDQMREHLVQVGAKPDEIERLQAEYNESDYAERQIQAQQARGRTDDATVYAYLENKRAAWRATDQDQDPNAAARDQNVAVDSGTQVQTVPADTDADPQLANQGQAAAAGAPGAGLLAGATAADGDQPPSELELREMVPTGPSATREVVLGWVDDAPDDNQRVLRAQAALYKEQHTEGKEERATLVKQLQRTIDGS
jgi:hypothetical protein